MSQTYNNVPMSESAVERVERADQIWSGPKLVILSFVVLGAAFTLLWLMAQGIIGPVQNDAEWGSEKHFLQEGLGPLD
jgi:hypothetical protein